MRAKQCDAMESSPPDATRRSLLELAGLAIAAAAFPSPASGYHSHARQASASPAGNSSVMNTLSNYMSEAAERKLPDEVTEKTKQHILDTLAAMISGSKLLPGQRALQFAQAYGGKEVSTVVAANILCGPIEAALANGVLAHADETDDTHPCG